MWWSTGRFFIQTVHQNTSHDVAQFEEKIGKPLRLHKKKVVLRKVASGTMKAGSSLFEYATSKIKCGIGAVS